MSFFSRNQDPVEPARADEVPFESLRPSPRTAARSSRRSSNRSSNTTRATIEPLADDTADGAAPLDPAQAEKARARRRLIGAIALALAAVVFVPMLFDRTQQPLPADDIAVQIPDRDAPFEGRRSVPRDIPRDIPDAGKGPLRPSGSLPTVTPGSGLGASPGASTNANTGVASPPIASVETSKPSSTSEAASEKSVAKATEKNVDKPAEKSNTPLQSDDPRALAALEGKPVPQGSAESVSGKGFAVQIAAFSVADKARSMRDQLNANGLKAYTEPLSTPQGLRTRVRLGPFASREAAERARQKLRTMKLDGSVVTL